MPLHVLQLGPYPPPEGGITRNMLAVRDALLAAGAKCSIVATSQSSKVVQEPDVYHPRSPAELIGLLHRLRPDLLHLHIGGDVTTRVLMLALAVATLGKRSMLTMHSGGYATDAHAKGAFAKFVFRKFSKLIAVNDHLADVFRAFGVPDARISVIAPYALKRPDPNVTVPDELADFIDTYSPALISIGGFEPEYEPLLQIKAMDRIRERFANAGLMIVGDGTLREDADEARRASESPDAITFAGNVPHAVILHLMKRADAVLRITRFDGDAISVREALFLGTPVIATDTGFRPAGVYLVEANDSAIAEAVAVVIEKEVVASDDDGSKNIREILALYGELAGGESDVQTVADQRVRPNV